MSIFLRNARKLRIPSRFYSKAVSCNRFLFLFDVNFVETTKYPVETVFGNEVLINDSQCSIQRNGIKVFVKSFGCSHNMSDGEYMSGILSRGGYDITNNKDEADCW